ncbi:MAG: hypothetical protein ACK4HW_04135 [Roseinatronobacter sp.]
MMHDLPPHALEDILKRERAALLTSDFDTLSDLIAAKEQCFASLSNNAPEIAQIRAIAALCTENQDLITAAQLGLAEARKSISSLLAIARNRVYNTGGTTQDLIAPPAAFSHRI